MAIPKTKLRPPTLRQPIVPRPQLTASFADRRPLTILSAPAGSGKTTLALEWLASRKSRVGWLSLDRDDNDPIRFINGVMGALQESGAKLRPPSGQRDIRRIVTELINQFDEQESVTLVLDDYHLISEELIHKALEYLLDHMPASLQLVIITRETPPLPLARLRARGQLREFRADELRFSEVETELFLNTIMGLKLSARQIQSVGERTQGWVAGLQMTGLSIQSNHNGSVSGREERQFIADYLLTEVFNHQPPDVQAFLLSSSIPDRFSIPLCDALQPGDASGMLAHIEKSNLFINTIDEWHQYHPLFREFLHAKLIDTYPEQMPELHRKTCFWLEQNGFSAEAIPHAFAIADNESAARLIAAIAPDYFKRGELAILRRWLDRLPESSVLQSPRLCLTQIWLLLDADLQGDAQAYIDRLGNHLEKKFKGEFLSVRAIHAAMTHQPELALDYARQAEQTPEAGDPFLQTYMSFALGAAQKMGLKFFQAEQSFRQALALADTAENSYMAVLAIANLSDVLYMQTRLTESENACREALRRFEDHSPDANHWYWTLARISYQRNRLDAALGYVNRAIDLSAEEDQATIHTRALALRAQIHYGLGRKELAQSDLDSADAMMRGMQDTNGLRSIIRQRILFALFEGNPDEARQWFAALSEMGDHPYPFYHAHVKARLLLAEKKLEEAGLEFQSALKQLEAMDLILLRIEILIWFAVCLTLLNRMPEARKTFGEAIKLAETGGVIRPFVEAQAGLTALIAGSGQGRFIRVLESAFRNGTQDEGPKLTRREVEILRLLASGLSNQEMADKLVVAEGTLKRHIANVYQKLSIHNRAQAIQYFNEHEKIHS